MRRFVTTAIAVALMGGAALAGPAQAADRGRSADHAKGRGPASAGVPTPGEVLQPREDAVPALGSPSARASLEAARRVLGGNAQRRDPSATIALRDLWMKRDRLRGAERREADSLLARPTDGAADPNGFGYTMAEAPPVCNGRLCVHYVQAGVDAPPSEAWVSKVLTVMDSVWTTEVDQLGYRPPRSDNGRGGTGQFDVYLKDLGGDLYGFCAGEKRVRKRTASGYCVLDNDFAAEQFPSGTPTDNLVVTAAHEFFHAVQYSYDYAEDPWMMESTATWMEERIASQVNDNRQYLPSSQIYAPYVPLDVFSRTSTFQYGNWVFWEYLSSRYGLRFVRKAWNQVGSLPGDGGRYSLTALQKLLRNKGGLTKNYAAFAAGNLTPAANFPEGSEYAFPKVRGGKRLTRGKRSKRFGTRVDHLASASYVWVPGRGLKGKRWKLRVHVDGPVRRTSPAAVVVVHKRNGKRQVRTVRLNTGGNGGTRVSFDKRKVGAVSVTLVNASTRFQCNRRTYLACSGNPLDDNLRFSVTGRVTKG